MVKSATLLGATQRSTLMTSSPANLLLPLAMLSIVVRDTYTPYCAFASPVDLPLVTRTAAMLSVWLSAITDSVEMESFNCFKLTASVSFTPAFTLLITWLPASIPSVVNAT